ncbi:hypothetical protein, partial [Salmonella sp. s58408]|uniref:hypothetical protein n=1 Tax=Salmonella sp. s58408 TaxID=3159701 RepID=UPI003980B237
QTRRVGCCCWGGGDGDGVVSAAIAVAVAAVAGKVATAAAVTAVAMKLGPPAQERSCLRYVRLKRACLGTRVVCWRMHAFEFDPISQMSFLGDAFFFALAPEPVAVFVVVCHRRFQALLGFR